MSEPVPTADSEAEVDRRQVEPGRRATDEERELIAREVRRTVWRLGRIWFAVWVLTLGFSSLGWYKSGQASKKATTVSTDASTAALIAKGLARKNCLRLQRITPDLQAFFIREHAFTSQDSLDAYISLLPKRC